MRTKIESYERISELLSAAVEYDNDVFNVRTLCHIVASYPCFEHLLNCQTIFPHISPKSK